MGEIIFEMVELQNGYKPRFDTLESTVDFFRSLGAMSTKLAEESELPVIAVLPVDRLNESNSL